ncbi:MAG: VanZ family protein [Bacteroidales bacterium]
MQTIRFFIPAILWVMVILLVTGYPGGNIPDNELLKIPYLDKVIHFALFAGLGTLLVYGFKKKYPQEKLSSKQLILCIALGVIYGILTEFFQYCCLGDRHGNLPDILANGFGTIFGVVLTAQLFKKMIDFQEKNEPD